MSDSNVRHLIPDERGSGRLWRDSRSEDEHKRSGLEVESVLHTAKVEIEANDPLTVALLFRELRQASGLADVDDALVQLSFTFSALTEDGVQAVKDLAELSWAHVHIHDPEVNLIYYRKVYGQD